MILFCEHPVYTFHQGFWRNWRDDCIYQDQNYFCAIYCCIPLWVIKKTLWPICDLWFRCFAVFSLLIVQLKHMRLRVIASTKSFRMMISRYQSSLQDVPLLKYFYFHCLPTARWQAIWKCSCCCSSPEIYIGSIFDGGDLPNRHESNYVRRNDLCFQVVFRSHPFLLLWAESRRILTKDVLI